MVIRLSADDPVVQSLFTSAQLKGVRKMQRIKRGKRAGQLTMEQEIELGLEARGLVGFSRQWRFAAPERQWSFDFAWVEHKVAVEYEGLIVTKVGDQVMLRGGHATITGFRDNCVKYNAAAMMGWMVLRYERELVRRGALFTDVEKVLRQRGFVPCPSNTAPLRHSTPDL